ncbi:GDSL esterase/lipase-like [Iris pallida]|uniref:GDSL esterase/lipase-like n=1 Tax=Iris pallida TaxID=29817 RepID=A0AAX6E8X4_IRIPA|nr:GDSL esterase/lipase-like [Iris pallida]KAJ6816156.1 GDSL esterase/lipase-like [Iris pallida]
MATVLHLCCCILLLCAGAKAAAVPAVYVLGDSLADVGNNDYLALSILKANYPHNGVDYPGGKATGRFNNGKNSADFIAEMLGVPSPPPYLSIRHNNNKLQTFLQGVNFASGGAGVLDTTNSGQCLTFSKQVEFFSRVCTDLVQQLGSDQANNHMAKSIFALVIGSNDIFSYNKSPKNTPPQEFVNSMITNLGEHLKTLYSLGARKFAFVGTGPVGCCPSRRDKRTGSCDAKANTMSLMFNAGAAPLLQQMKSEHGDMHYSFFNSSSALSAILQNPATYGFTEVKDACCGLGSLIPKVGCLPISSLCTNRSSHVFWDFVHPSQRTAELLTTTFFHGSSPYVYPVNVKALTSL